MAGSSETRAGDPPAVAPGLPGLVLVATPIGHLGDLSPRALAAFRPDPTNLPPPQEFKALLDELSALAGQNLRLRDDLWDNTREPADLTEFDRMLETASRTIEFLRDSTQWQLLALQAGRDGKVARKEWESLIRQIETTWTEVHECHTLVMEHGPTLTDTREPHVVLEIVDAIIAHVGTTVGGSIGVKNAVVSWDHAIRTTQTIIDAASTVRKDIFFLTHGGPINTPEDAARVIQNTQAVGFVGASSLERMGVEESLTGLTRRFKSLTLPPPQT